MKYQQVSMIDDLPELEQVESRYAPSENYSVSDKVVSLGINEMEQPRIRGIREKMVLHEGSGMRSNYSDRLPGMAMAENTQRPDASQDLSYIQPQVRGEVIEHMEMPYLDCRNIYDHISKCPICAKLYKQDNTMYIIFIAILIIACALLLKRVLRV